MRKFNVFPICADAHCGIDYSDADIMSRINKKSYKFFCNRVSMGIVRMGTALWYFSDASTNLEYDCAISICVAKDNGSIDKIGLESSMISMSAGYRSIVKINGYECSATHFEGEVWRDIVADPDLKAIILESLWDSEVDFNGIQI